jgi:hypothetical protein
MKIQILHNCLECGNHEWIRGKPRCKHPEMKLEIINDDGLYYPRCPTDGTKEFIEGCPLIDLSFLDISKDWFIEELQLRMKESK